LAGIFITGMPAYAIDSPSKFSYNFVVITGLQEKKILEIVRPEKEPV
jgi:hypothetical protein